MSPGDGGIRVMTDQILPGDGKSVFLKCIKNQQVSLFPLFPGLGKKFNESRVMMIQIKPQDMDFLFLIEAGKLNSGNQLQRQGGGSA